MERPFGFEERASPLCKWPRTRNGTTISDPSLARRNVAEKLIKKLR